MKYLIYKHTNKINGKSYIGQTSRSINERLNEHLKSDSVFGKALRKYGIENFQSENH